MNIFICVKQVPDTETKIVLKSDSGFLDTSSIKWIMNPYDEFAVELAVQIKERLKGVPTLYAVRVGESNPSCEVIRTAMAMGVDEGILVETPTYQILDPYLTAKSMFEAINKSGKKPDLILAGKQSIDAGFYQVPQILAELFKLPFITGISSYKHLGESEFTNGVEVGREIEGGGMENYTLNFPALLSCNKGLNAPRYPSLPGIMKSKKKVIQKFTFEELGLNSKDTQQSISKLYLPAERPAGKKFVADQDDASLQAKVVHDVVELLKNEAKVL